MSDSEKVDSRVCFLIDWLAAAVQVLHERNISPGLVNMIVDRLEGYSGRQDALGLKMLMTGLGMKGQWAHEEGRLDEALALYERLSSLVGPDDPRHYLDIAGVVRVLLEKGEQAAAFHRMGSSAATAVDTTTLSAQVAFDMLVLARYGDLAESVKTEVFLEALDKYERRFLPEENLGLVDLWRRDPQRALDVLLDHSPHPPLRQDPDRTAQDEGESSGSPNTDR